MRGGSASDSQPEDLHDEEGKDLRSDDAMRQGRPELQTRTGVGQANVVCMTGGAACCFRCGVKERFWMGCAA